MAFSSPRCIIRTDAALFYRRTSALACAGKALSTLPYSILMRTMNPSATTRLSLTARWKKPAWYIVSDSLQCDTSGYKYVATVPTQSAPTSVKYIRLNITSGTPASASCLRRGSYCRTPFTGGHHHGDVEHPTDGDWFGDALCFILSAHDSRRSAYAAPRSIPAWPSPSAILVCTKDVAVCYPFAGTGGGADCFGGDLCRSPGYRRSLPIVRAGTAVCSFIVVFSRGNRWSMQDDNTSCTDSGGTVYDYQAASSFSYGGIARHQP